MPLWPVNQCTPFLSKIAVLRLVYPLPSGSGQAFTWRVFGSTRTIAFWPPSVSHGAPSAPAITPCGEEPAPSGTNSDRKSTRLNSSHLVISYAVFCLKKKKTTQERRHAAQNLR